MSNSTLPQEESNNGTLNSTQELRTFPERSCQLRELIRELGPQGTYPEFRGKCESQNTKPYSSQTFYNIRKTMFSEMFPLMAPPPPTPPSSCVPLSVPASVSVVPPVPAPSSTVKEFPTAPANLLEEILRLAQKVGSLESLAILVTQLGSLVQGYQKEKIP